ncbi:MAG TPA: ferredoxin--NADP reductase [Blastocatellia bacterium]|nr:ferredoxin--NADP reductase [Blastocatellia bacterium]
MSLADFHQAQVVDRVDFCEDLAMFKVKMDVPFDFKAGQYVSLAVEGNGKIIQRPYSIVSSPLEPLLEFFIELVPNGELTPRLWELKPGSKILVRNRFVGTLVLDEANGVRRHLMAGTVTGAVPYISIVRHESIRLKKDGREPHQFVIIHGASRSSEFGSYKDEMAEIARQGWMTYIPTVSRPWEDPEWKGEKGRVEDIFRKHADRFGFNGTNSTGYACGHPQMIENVKGILQRAGFGKEHIRTEKFFTVQPATQPQPARVAAASGACSVAA